MTPNIETNYQSLDGIMFLVHLIWPRWSRNSQEVLKRNRIITSQWKSYLLSPNLLSLQLLFVSGIFTVIYNCANTNSLFLEEMSVIWRQVLAILVRMEDTKILLNEDPIISKALSKMCDVIWFPNSGYFCLSFLRSVSTHCVTLFHFYLFLRFESLTSMPLMSA